MDNRKQRELLGLSSQELEEIVGGVTEYLTTGTEYPPGVSPYKKARYSSIEAYNLPLIGEPAETSNSIPGIPEFYKGYSIFGSQETTTQGEN
jgi:hypothetical protein